MNDKTMGDTARRRFPRLIAAIQAGTGLAESRAVTALVEYQAFGLTDRDDTVEPDLQALGGPLAAIRLGIRRRHRRDPRERRLDRVAAGIALGELALLTAFAVRVAGLPGCTTGEDEALSQGSPAVHHQRGR